MVQRLDGRQLAGLVEARLRQVIANRLVSIGRPPGLAVLRVGEDPASAIYVGNKEKACKRVGVLSYGTNLPSGTPAEDIMGIIERLNTNNDVDGILLQLPLPVNLDERLLLAAITPEKDVDGIHATNLGRLLRGEPGPRSCTPAGIMALLQYDGIKLPGQRAVVVGRSILVGQPMALMLQAANATVTVAHSHTRNLAEVTGDAEILVVAAGQPEMIGAEHVRPGAVVVDVGIHRRPEGGLCGDVRADEVKTVAAALSPVPGGVGPMTVTMLLVNTVVIWLRCCGSHGSAKHRKTLRKLRFLQ